jgi:hypothetical protein
MKRRFVLMAALLAGYAMPVMAATTYVVDDSMSEVLRNTLPMKWDSVVPRRGERATVSGAITVLVRLNLAPWRGRPGRVYMTLPALPSGPVSVTWTTHGALLPGHLQSGERVLVYAGLMPGGLLEDTVQLTIQADGQRLARPEQLHFGFEIDVETP